MKSFSSKFRNFLCDWQNFCRKNWKCFCHNDIVTSFIYCYWRADVVTRVFVEAIFGIWRFFEIFTNFQRFSRFHLRVKVWAQIIFQNVKVIGLLFNSFAIDTNKLLEFRQFDFWQKGYVRLSHLLSKTKLSSFFQFTSNSFLSSF